MGVIGLVVTRCRRAQLDVLAPLAGVPLLVRSVRCLLTAGVIDRVLVEGGGRDDAVVKACAGLPVDVRRRDQALYPVPAHAARGAARCRETSGLPDVVVVHDAARPLTPPALVVAVVEAVRSGHDVAVPVLPLADTVKQVDADGLVCGTPDRAGLRIVQTPQAVRADLLATVGLPVDPLDVALDLVAAGLAVHTLPGHPMAFAVRSRWDLELAELLVGRGAG